MSSFIFRDKGAPLFRDSCPPLIPVEAPLTLQRSSFNNPEETVVLIQASLDTLGLFFPWATKDYGPASFQQWVDSVKQNENTCEYDYRLAEKLIGHFAIRLSSSGLPEFGYWLGTTYAGYGYITKAIQASLPILREMGYTKVEVNYLPDNHRSRATALRNGFKELGLETITQGHYPEGTVIMRSTLNLE